MERTDVKESYAHRADHITGTKLGSPYPLRRYVHAQQYESVASYIQPCMRVLDAGCGEGTLSFLLAERGATVVACDISEPNIEYAKKQPNPHHIEFLTADLENLPFEDGSFDLVISSHVLEHLPDFEKGLREIMRVTRSQAVVAIPTVFSPCSLVQVGHGWFYLKGPRSFAAFFVGVSKMVVALLRGAEGVDEGYGGTNLPHVFRFPWILPRMVMKNGWRVEKQEADSLCLPYFDAFLPIVRWLNARKGGFILRNFGYGTLYFIEK